MEVCAAVVTRALSPAGPLLDGDNIVEHYGYPFRRRIIAAVVAESLADVVLMAHAAFALFVAAGGLLVLRWRPLIWLHVPAALWGAAVEFGGWICPLTLLENRLRSAASEATYSGDCIAHYMSVVLYPGALTRSMQVLLGMLVLAMNVGIYRLLWRRAHHAALAQ
jgi:Protein of Unknown function (DUF2784)